MSEVTARSLIEARLAAGYAGAYEIFYPNTTNDAPSPDTDAVDGFITVTYQAGDAFQADTYGAGGTFRHPGLLILSVFALRGLGAGAANALADTLAAIFRGKSDTSGTTKVVYLAPMIRAVGADGAWYQVDVEVPFDRDTQFSTA